jgi:hypothetical protein
MAGPESWPPPDWPSEPDMVDVSDAYVNRECFDDDPWWDWSDKVDDARDRKEADHE